MNRLDSLPKRKHKNIKTTKNNKTKKAKNKSQKENKSKKKQYSAFSFSFLFLCSLPFLLSCFCRIVFCLLCLVLSKKISNSIISLFSKIHARTTTFLTICSAALQIKSLLFLVCSSQLYARTTTSPFPWFIYDMNMFLFFFSFLSLSLYTNYIKTKLEKYWG